MASLSGTTSHSLRKIIFQHRHIRVVSCKYAWFHVRSLGVFQNNGKVSSFSTISYADVDISSIHSFTDLFLKDKNISKNNYDNSNATFDTADIVDQCNQAMQYWSSLEDGKVGATICQTIFDRLNEIHKIDENRIGPNTETYLFLLSAWAKSKEPWSAERATQILEHMEKAYDSGTNIYAKPNGQCYTLVIESLCKTDQYLAAWQAEKVLLRYIARHYADATFDTDFNSDLFMSVINSFTTHRLKRDEEGILPSYAVRRLFQEMEKLYVSGNYECKPKIESYNVLLRHWRDGAKSPWQAKETLEKLHAKFLLEEDEDLNPNTESYNIVLEAIAKSKITKKAEMSARILTQMVRHHLDGNPNAKPNVESFNYVFGACSTTDSDDQRVKRAALRVASVTFKHLQSSDFSKPNSVTYGLMLMSCDNLLPIRSNERKTLTEAIFKSCCRDGHVDAFVVNCLRKVCSPNDFHNLVSKRLVNDDFLESWTCNVSVSKKEEEVVSSMFDFTDYSNTVTNSPSANKLTRGRSTIPIKAYTKTGQKLLRGGRS